MTAFSGPTCVAQHTKTTEQMKELQQAIKDSTHMLEEVRRTRLRVKGELMECTRESERRLDLIMEKREVVDELQQLGHLLQEERDLSEQLSGHASMKSNQRNNAQERTEFITNKARALAAEILEVKQCLAEAKTRNMAARSRTHVPTSKSKRNQNKPK